MNCSKFQELTDLYIENALSESEKHEFEQHLAECASCRDDFEFSKEIYNTLHTLEPLSVPDDFLDKLNSKIDESEVLKKPKRGFFKIPVKYYGAAACVLLAVALGVNNSDLLQNLASPETESPVIQTQSEDKVEEIVPAQTDESAEEAVDEIVSDTSETAVDVSNKTDALEEAKALIGKVSALSKNTTSNTTQTKKSEKTSDKANATGSVASADTTSAQVVGESAKDVSKEQIEEAKKKIDSNSYKGRVVIASAVENAVVISEESVEKTAREVDYIKSYELVKEAAEAKANPAVVGLSNLSNVEVVSDSVIKYTDHDGEGEVGAVGNSVIVYKRDADKISDILQKFYTRECGEFYIISDSEYEMFLGELEANGIDYQKSNLKNTESEDVMFKLVIA